MSIFRLPCLPAFVAVSLTMLGCAPSAEQPAETPAEPDVVEVVNPLAPYAGTWNVSTYAPDSDEPTMTVTMTATDSPGGWSFQFGHLDAPVPATIVGMEGDSLTLEFGNYPSGLREGVMVDVVRSHVTLVGDSLAGRFEATYTDGGARSGRLAGRRAQ
jgi:hypothetical protein